MEKKVQRNFLWIALLVLGTIWILARHNQVAPYQTDNGLIFGTVYKVTYQYDKSLKEEIEAELKRFDGSLSPFNDTSAITRINRNEDIVPDTFFTNVFCRSMEISKETNGAFDITVAPLANAWGFGFKKGAFVQRCGKGICGGHRGPTPGEEGHPQLHGRYRRRSGCPRPKPAEWALAYRPEQADRRLSGSEPRVTSRIAGHGLGHGHIGQLSQLLL